MEEQDAAKSAYTALESVNVVIYDLVLCGPLVLF